MGNIGGLAHAELAASGEQVPRRARASGAPAPRPRPSVITREAGAERAVRLSTLLVCCLDWSSVVRGGLQSASSQRLSDAVSGTAARFSDARQPPARLASEAACAQR